VLQEVGSIIGKKGEIVKRFREEVSINYILVARLAYFLTMKNKSHIQLYVLECRNHSEIFFRDKKINIEIFNINIIQDIFDEK